MEMAQETNQKEDPKLVAVPEPEVPDEGEKVDGASEEQGPKMNVKQVTEEEIAKNPELGALASMGMGMAQMAMANAQQVGAFSPTDLQKPSMAEAAENIGPQGPVGPRRLRKEESAPDAAMKLEKETPKANPPFITLSRERLLEIELIATKKQLADSDEKLILASLGQVKQRAKELQAQEAQMLHQIREEHGVSVGKSIRLVDKEKGLCKVE